MIFVKMVLLAPCVLSRSIVRDEQARRVLQEDKVGQQEYLLLLLAAVTGSTNEGAQFWRSAWLMTEKIKKIMNLYISVKLVDTSCSSNEEEFRQPKARAEQIANGDPIEVWDLSNVQDSHEFDRAMHGQTGDPAKRRALDLGAKIEVQAFKVGILAFPGFDS